MRLRRQHGFVSLTAVTLMSILILILTVAMARLMAGELHQATDAADSIKAYYTAQGIAEDTAEQVHVALGSLGATGSIASLNRNCGSTQAVGAFNYTIPTIAAGTADCVQVATDKNTVNAQISANQTQTFDLTNSTLTTNGYITRLVLSWDDLSTSAGGPFSSTLNTAGTAWQSTGTANQPPVMEVGVTNYYPGQQASNIDPNYSGYLVLAPQCTASGCPAPSSTPKFTYDCYLLNSPASPADCPISPAPHNPLIQVQCGGAVKRCTAEIDNLVPPQRAGYRTVVTLTPLFHDAQFSLSAYAANPSNPAMVSPTQVFPTCLQSDGSNNTGAQDCLAPIAMSNALVDVTVSMGDTNRRIQMTVPVRPSQNLNNVLQADTDICKSFYVINYAGGLPQVAQSTPKPACKISN